MKIWPQTIMGRTLVVLLAGMVISTMITFAYQFAERSALLPTIGGWHGAERISDIITKVELAPVPERTALAKSFETPGFRAAWSLETALAPRKLDWQGRQVRLALEDFLGPISPDALRIEKSNYTAATRAVPHAPMAEWTERMKQKDLGPAMDEMMKGFASSLAMPGQTMMGQMMTNRGMMNQASPGPDRTAGQTTMSVLLISYRLNDGTWLTFLTPPTPMGTLWNARFFWPSLLSLLIVLGVSVWAVRRSTDPLNRLAQAAGRLGLDVNAPPMAEDGPREVRRAATAFNRMQRRLQAFVKDRTHMLAAISHDLRTPITRLRLRAEFIDDDEQRAKMLSDLTDMEAMISATLQFARDDVTAEVAQPLDLAVLIQELCQDTQASGDDVRYDGPPSLHFTGRAVGLKRLVGNLIGNAVRYGQRARVTLGKDAAHVVLRVGDDGPGIPDEMLERVFDPFVRGEGSRSRETGGTGLGLTAVRTIAQAHGGQVELINHPETGFEVRVTLPLR